VGQSVAAAGTKPFMDASPPSPPGRIKAPLKFWKDFGGALHFANCETQETIGLEQHLRIQQSKFVAMSRKAVYGPQNPS
jgi:hypothetical protein